MFAVDHFQNKNNDFDNETFKDEGCNLYAFFTSRLEKGFVLSKLLFKL